MSQMVIVLQTMQKGKFPSYSKKNPKKECNIVALRSGKMLDKPFVDEDDEPTQVAGELINALEPKLEGSVEKKQDAPKLRVESLEIKSWSTLSSLPFVLNTLPYLKDSKKRS